MRRLAEGAQERAPHPLGIAKSDLGGDRVDWRTAALDPLARRLDPQPLDGARRRHAGLLGEAAGEVARAHRRPVGQLLDGLELFGLGYSWGGYESLVIPFACASYRTATSWAPGGPALRFSVGLEDIDDLKDDLARGFDRMKAAP